MDELSSNEQLNTDPVIPGIDDLVLLGRGGMSAVYRARDKVLDRSVAIKIINFAGDDSSRLLERFSAEVKILAAMKHPNIVGVQRYGVTNAGNPFLVMDYVDGITLRNYLNEKGTLPARDMRVIFTQVLSALAEAHERGIVHRDIKPENIMISILTSSPEATSGASSNDSAFLHVTLLDFGVAKAFASQNVGLTKTGDVIGTPKYMSPEQCIGKTLDHRADLYAVAAVMFESIYAKVPFEFEAVSETLYHKLNDTPESLFSKGLPATTSHAFKSFFVRALSTRPESRFQNAKEMSTAISALPDKVFDKVLQANAKGLIIVCLASVLVIGFFIANVPKASNRKATQTLPQLSEREVNLAIAKSRTLRDLNRKDQALRQLKDAYRLLGKDQSNKTKLLRGSLLAEMMPMQDGVDAVDTCNALIPILDKFNPSDSQRVTVRSYLANQYHVLGRQPEAVKSMEECAQLIQTDVPMKPIYLWRAQMFLVLWYREVGALAKSISLRNQLWETLDGVSSAEDPGERARIMIELLISWVNSGESGVARQKMNASAEYLMNLIQADENAPVRSALLKNAEELCSELQLPGVSKKFHEAQSKG